MIDKMKVACFPGHRKLPDDCAELQENLEKAIKMLIQEGVMFFGSGGALGFDQVAAKTVLKLKKDYSHIKLIMVLPCPPNEQSLKWNDQQKKQYCAILEQADKVRIISPQYTNSCMLDRNRHLVDNSAYLICYLREKSGEKLSPVFLKAGYHSHNCFDSTNFKEGYDFLRKSQNFRRKFCPVPKKKLLALAPCLREEALSAQSVDRTSTPKADSLSILFRNFEILFKSVNYHQVP